MTPVHSVGLRDEHLCTLVLCHGTITTKILIHMKFQCGTYCISCISWVQVFKPCTGCCFEYSLSHFPFPSQQCHFLHHSFLGLVSAFSIGTSSFRHAQSICAQCPIVCAVDVDGKKLPAQLHDLHGQIKGLEQNLSSTATELHRTAADLVALAKQVSAHHTPWVLPLPHFPHKNCANMSLRL